MWIYYLLLIIAAIFFATQFYITKKYQLVRGDSIKSSLRLILLAYITISIFFLFKGLITYKFDIEFFDFSIFTFFIAFGSAIVTLLCVLLGVKVLKIGNMSLYSIFMQLGSIILPTIVSLIFYNETLNWINYLGLAIMVLSLFLSFNKSEAKTNFKSILLYIAIFLLNGSIGIFFTIHQHNPQLTAGYDPTSNVINNDLFMFWYGICMVFLSFLTFLIVRFTDKNNDMQFIKTNEFNEAKSKTKILFIVTLFVLPIIYGICNGLGNYFIVYSTSPNRLISSVTYPIVNGGSILFSTLYGFILLKEKITIKNIIQIILIIISLILFIIV